MVGKYQGAQEPVFLRRGLKPHSVLTERRRSGGDPATPLRKASGRRVVIKRDRQGFPAPPFHVMFAGAHTWGVELIKRSILFQFECSWTKKIFSAWPVLERRIVDLSRQSALDLSPLDFRPDYGTAITPSPPP